MAVIDSLGPGAVGVHDVGKSFDDFDSLKVLDVLPADLDEFHLEDQKTEKARLFSNHQL